MAKLSQVGPGEDFQYSTVLYSSNTLSFFQQACVVGQYQCYTRSDIQTAALHPALMTLLRAVYAGAISASCANPVSW